MRISTFLLLIGIQVSAGGFSQKVTLNAKEITLAQAFNSIKQQTGYSFFWEQQLLDKAPAISISVTDVSITEALDKCLEGLPLSYKIKGKIAFITNKKTDADPVPGNELFAPAYTISGIVKDENGKPLQGASLVLLPLNMQTQTNEAGMYKFSNVPQGRYTIEVTYISYHKITRQIVLDGNKTSFDIIMQLAQAQAEEVVVINTGYKQLEKTTATGSYSVITAKDIEQTPSVNLMERLEGKVAGVRFDVRNNKVQVRGVSSFGPGVNADPLIVIDGFPFIDNKFTNIAQSNFVPGKTTGSTNPANPVQPAYANNSILSSFNPNDIESITFLKDAAAAAIWGSQAANGVIVITTKKGKRNSPASIALGATYSTSAPADLGHINQMNSKDYVAFEQELFDKNFYSDPYTFYRNPAVSEAVDWMFKAKRGDATAAQRDSALNVLSNRSNLGQMKDYLLQRVVSQQYNLSLSGGGENSSYNISGNYTKDNPVFKSNYAESYFLNSSTTNSFLKNRITFGSLLNYTYSKSVMNTAALAALSAGTYGLTPYDMLVNSDGTSTQLNNIYTKRVTDSLVRLGHLPWTYSPADEMNYNNTVFTKHAIRVNLSLTGKITDWLNVQLSGQLQRNIDQQSNLQDLNSIYTRQIVNEGTVVTTLTNGTRQVTNNVPKGGILKLSNANSEDYGLRGQVNVNKSFEGGKHQMQVLAGAEIRQTKSTGFKTTRYGYDPVLSTAVTVNPTTPYSTMFGTAFTQTLGNTDGGLTKARVRYLSYFADAGYTFLNRYYLSASARFDDGSMVGVRRQDRGTPLWSVGARWNIKKESFMDNIAWLNALSIRGSYGSGGNIPKGVAYYTTFNPGIDAITGLPVTNSIIYGNPTLTWQTTKILNGGIDANMFNDRLAVTVEVYQKRSENIYYNFPLNSTFGMSTAGYNTATLAGHGVEVSLIGQLIRQKDFQWIANFNFAYNANKVTDNRFEAAAATSVGQNRITTGYATDNMFAYRWAGLNAQGQGQIYNAKGDKIVGAANTFPTVVAADQIYVGRSTAPYFGGLTNTFLYKNLSLSARAVYNLGHKFFKQDLVSGHYPTGTQMSGRLGTTKALVNRWRKPGDEAITNIPGIGSNNGNIVDWYNYSDFNVRDAGNVRLQQVTLGYMLPRTLLSKVPVFKAASVNATVSNLGIIWRKNKDGIDPDYVMTGDYNNLPPTKNYVINLNLTF